MVGAGGEPAFDVIEPGGAELADAPLVDLPKRRIVLVAEIAAHLGEVFVARGTAILEIGCPLAVAAIVVLTIVIVTGGRRAEAHEDEEEQRVNELPGHWFLR